MFDYLYYLFTFAHIYFYLNKGYMEEKEIGEIILELKSKLKKIYGEKFFKFYLCEFTDGRWEGLISTKETNGYRGGSYYRIKEGIVEEEKLS